MIVRFSLYLIITLCIQVDLSSQTCHPGGSTIKTAFYSISGKVSYNDTSTTHQPITNTLVILYSTNGVLVDSTKTDMNGYYQFNNVTDGSYFVETICNKSWGGGSASDALRIMRYWAGIGILSGVNLMAADVDASGTANSLDALYIGHRFVFMINSFPAGDWVFEQDTFSVDGANVIHDIMGLCTGDVNASYVVPLN